MLVDEVQRLGEQAWELAAGSLWSLSGAETVEVIRAGQALERAGAALKARAVREAAGRGVPAEQGYKSLTGWLQALLVIDLHPARDLVVQAAALGRAVVEQAVLEGRADLRQAAVIAQTVDLIPATLADLQSYAATNPAPDGLAGGPGLTAGADCAGADPVGFPATGQVVQEAATTMIGWARRLPAQQLRQVGERILGHVAPHLADLADAAALAIEEKRAYERRGLSQSRAVHGLVRLSGSLGVEDAAILTAALSPLSRPVSGVDSSPAQRRADALIELCRQALHAGDLPDDGGGEPPQLAVTVAYDPLTRALGAGIIDNGERLSPAAVRRVACDCRVLPILLGSGGQICDAGRSRRLATGPLRRLLNVRDGGCAWPDCDRPVRWTHAHHVRSWACGGLTDLDNLVLLCGAHHRLIHDDNAGWHIRMGADGRPDFIPPAFIDPTRTPRRNLYHLRH